MTIALDFCAETRHKVCLLLRDCCPLIPNPASWPLRGVRSFYCAARFASVGAVLWLSLANAQLPGDGDGCAGQPVNSRIIPGLFPGLFAVKSGLLPCFVRFSCTHPRTGKLRKPIICRGFNGPS